MSEGFLFSVFPTETVQANMQTGGVKVSASEVDRLWTSYQKAMDSGLKPYAKGMPDLYLLLNFMVSDTGYAKMTVAAFLNALETAVKVQGWDWKWLDPKSAKEAGQSLSIGESVQGALKATGEGAKSLLAPTLDPVANVVKYASIAAVAAAVIYGLYQFKGKKGKGLLSW